MVKWLAGTFVLSVSAVALGVAVGANIKIDALAARHKKETRSVCTIAYSYHNRFGIYRRSGPYEEIAQRLKESGVDLMEFSCDHTESRLVADWQEDK